MNTDQKQNYPPERRAPSLKQCKAMQIGQAINRLYKKLEKRYYKKEWIERKR